MNTDNHNYNPKDEYSESAQRHVATGKRMFMIAWALILTLAFMFFSWFGRSSAYDAEVKYSDNAVEIHVPLTRTHQYEVFGKINDTEVTFLIDTGATVVAVSDKIAKKAGLTQGMATTVQTAAGAETAYITKIDKLIINEEIILYNINATINPNMHADTVLLGMGALKQIDFQQTRDTLILKQYR